MTATTTRPAVDSTDGELSHRQIVTILVGLVMGMFLAALDQTIVATALPRIVSDLGGITQYSWVFTAYMLTSTVTVPLYGRLGDVHGRRPLMLIAITIFLVGSALCGLAQGMTELIVARALQGIGVEVRTGAMVTACDADGVSLDDERIETREPTGKYRGFVVER